MAEKEKQSFVIYRNWMEMVMGLPDDEALDLTRAIFAYCLNRDYNPDPVAAAIFDTIEPLLESDIEKWHRTCEVRALVGSKGGKQKQANAKQNVAIAKQMLPNAKQLRTDNDNDNDSDNESVYYNDVKKEDAVASKKETVAALICRWNGYKDRGSIPSVRSVTTGSKVWKSIFARVDDVGIDKVNEVMDMVFESDYLKGMKTDWCAKFDWMFLPSNFDKIQNGNYRNVKQAPQGLHSSQERGGYEEMMELRRRAEAERSIG